MIKTAESVSPAHPDKMCDQISDAILDFCLDKDPYARVAIETLGGHGQVVVMGEITMNGKVIYKENIEEIVHRITGDVNLKIEINIVNQSPEISQGVDIGGAGDQGIMIGYACRDNDEMVPQEQHYARSLCKYIFNEYPYDGKTQITLGDDGLIDTIVASFQNATKEQLMASIGAWISEKALEPEIKTGVTILTNPAGDWSQGGFDADTGLTGRKLMVDNYGPNISIGGGAFSGKDATKVDRSGAYIARYVAVDMLRRYPNSESALVKIAYAIGKVDPVMVTTEMTFKGTEDKLVSQIVSGYDLTPNGIIESLKLRVPQFEATARWGHFGNGFTWDK